jgi:hypothetical protein
MAVQHAKRLDDLAEELTLKLSIPFTPGGRGTITFRGRLRVTDWAVPLMFDGHAARDHDALVPTDFVGHVLWPTLKASRDGQSERPWWRCTMSVPVAEAILDALRDEDDHPLDEDVWQIGRDVLLEDVFTTAPARPAKRRRVA